ncbi:MULTISPECIES: phosphate ABC transporter substrate-binding protein PstS [unclassified Nodularia (in: cyanobacteria)]|uniref:phosphate ABC transporter substrate-binding protein PstS n=1 Tax=unclassified Nodularia (in: cyanobacteria) TaxID=2656917 RepID=UPI00187EDDB8|nr:MULTISPECIES: phosphate ABC transporter substrate-binding protein PstS [unclassified Nodularia (in: cyanobacteria)]MBE9200936.1 phosphate ABC transporter substrate-binding protein PstS [Nodularia sp. LEGE 06071]MCC2692478.1 phosphate ABC transporter substrate-binding protein PstS [Nodularia sp. LEGE 04288]
MVLNRKVLLGIASLPILLVATACTPSPEASNDASPPGQNVSGSGQKVTISGAGASFPAPLFQRWFDAYNRQVDSNVQVSYQSIGSGAGLEQYIKGTVDFGASEAPITDSADRLKSFKTAYNYDPIQVPMTGGFLSFSYNLPGVNDQELKLSRTTYCGIVTGKITRWNDPAIAKDNPSLKIPDLGVTFAHRSDGSGTTFVFTNHIQTVCPEWKSGAGTSVDWPVGIGGQGNEGVAATIQQNEGAIGYLSYAYAALNDIDSALIENKAGTFIAPSPEAAGKALLDQPVPEDFALLVPDPSGKDSYPIVGLAWVMIYRNYEDDAKWQAMRKVFEWSLGPEGKKIAEELLYVPIPDALAERIKKQFDTVNAK